MCSLIYVFFYLTSIFFFEGGRKAGRKGIRMVGRKEGMKEGRKERRKWGGRKGGREGREGRKSSNERDIANLDLEVYKLISFFFERRKEKKISKGEEERGRERGRVNGNIALF